MANNKMKWVCAAVLSLGQLAVALSARAQSAPRTNADSTQQAQTAADAKRLQATLDPLAQSEVMRRRLIGWSLVATGVGGATASVYAAIKLKDGDWLGPASGGTIAAVIGVELLAAEGPFEYVARYAHHDPAHPAGTEQEWRRVADANRVVRRAAGGGLLIDSALAVALGINLAASQDATHSRAGRNASLGIFFGLGGVEAICGTWLLVTQSPVERALRDYERTTGHVVSDGASAPQFRFSPINSGLVASLSGTF